MQHLPIPSNQYNQIAAAQACTGAINCYCLSFSNIVSPTLKGSESSDSERGFHPSSPLASNVFYKWENLLALICKGYMYVEG